MSRLVRFLCWTAAGVGFLTVAAAALYYANDWWQSGIMTVSILCWLGALLAAIYSLPDRRPVAIGAVVASLLYILFALGPWFRGNVGPWLVTSQALAHVETKWLGRQPPQPVQQVFTTSFPYPILVDSGSTISTSFIASTTGSTAISIPAVSSSSRFVEIGHWLCGWIAAAIGGLAAARMARRGSRDHDSKEATA